MKTLQNYILALLLVAPALAAQDINDEILMTIDDRKVTVEEFERIYHKNNSNTALEQQTVDEYLDLFINFKLKVIEAENMGLDTTQAFLREFNGYRKQLAKPYLSDQEEVDNLVKEAFERAQKEVHVEHILIRMNEFAGHEDTTLTYNKAMEIRNRILAGEDFGTMAKAYSDDPSAKSNGGDLGWFTVFRMVYPFETACYNTPKGQISMPFRSRFGYHLVKVLDVRPARGNVQVAHIMVMVPESMTDEQKAKAGEKIDRLYDSIQAGKDFATMASKYSEDRGSAQRGGELPWFGTGRMIKEFEDACFALKNIGDVSRPIRTSFGWHIIKLLDRKTYDDFEEVKADLQSAVTKSDRNAYSRTAMIERIKNKNGFTENPANLQAFYSLVDTSIFTRQWDASGASSLKGVLFTIGDWKVTQGDFARYLDGRQGGRKINLKVFINNEYRSFVEQQVLQYEEDQLPGKYPEFRNLVQEYHDGILLFDLTDRMVWSKAVEDSAGLEAFFDENRNNYKWEKRMDATVYTCRDEDVARFAKGLLENQKKKKKTKKPGPADIQSKTIAGFADNSCITFENRKLEKGDNDLADKMDWNQDRISGIQTEKGKAVFLVNNKILKPEPKQLEECRGLVTADYQNYLEKKWIESLRAKYPVHVNEELLSRIK
jgi:peptidyl-prolyl cis-trans isomerase SurA